MSNIDEKLASIPTSPLLAERMTKEQPSCENDPKIVGCSDDTISRQAVIDLLKQMRKDGDMVPWEGKNVFARIRELPTIQPELGTNLAEVGTDLISRQDAIDDIWTVSPLARLDRKWVDRWLRQLPPIQPKKGKWIYHIDDLFPAESTMECNQCHAEQPLTCDDEFCPHCGAKMEVTI